MINKGCHRDIGLFIAADLKLDLASIEHDHPITVIDRVLHVMGYHERGQFQGVNGADRGIQDKIGGATANRAIRQPP